MSYAAPRLAERDARPSGTTAAPAGSVTDGPPGPHDLRPSVAGHTDATDPWRAVFELVAARSAHAVLVAQAPPSDPSTVRIAFVNEAFASLFGYAPDDLLGAPTHVLCGPDTDPAALERLRGLGPGDGHLNMGLHLHRRDGGSFAADVSYSVEQSADGAIWHLATVRAVGAPTDAELAARSEEWAHAILGGVTDLIVVTDRASVITWVSPSIVTRLGHRHDEVIGTSVLSLIHPDQAELAVHEFTELVEGRSAKRPTVYRVRHKDGGWRSITVTASDLSDHPAVQGVVISAADVTDRVAAEQLLHEQAAILEAIARGASVDLVLRRITRMVEQSVTGSTCAIGIRGDDDRIQVASSPGLPSRLVRYLDDAGPDDEIARTFASDPRRAIDLDLDDDALGAAGAVFRDAGFTALRLAKVHMPGTDELLGALAVFRDVAGPVSDLEAAVIDRARDLVAVVEERRRFLVTLEHQAMYDALTGLPNRMLLLDRIEQALDRPADDGSTVAVLLVDLDRFKVINDAVGHARGDELLVEVGHRLTERLCAGDTMGRFGGDEFVVVCPRVRGEAGAVRAAERLQDALAEPITVAGEQVFVHASIGISLAREGTTDAESLLRTADVAVYRAKDQGRNQIVVFAEEVDLQAVSRLALEQAIRRGIAEEEFELHYQPVVSLADGAMREVEALVRWNRPDHGMVFPDAFIPVAEETGLIVPLGWWILREACRHAAAWPALPGGDEVRVAVNLSARQLASPELEPRVSAVLAETGLAPHRLAVEVTESALIRDVDQAKQALEAVRALGVKVAIDDFGTGYASLEYVRQFTMADYLKIDRAFIAAVGESGSQDEAIVAAALALARSIGLTVVAEGVETVHQMEALRRLGCEQAQGYLFSRPVPVADARALLQAPPGWCPTS